MEPGVSVRGRAAEHLLRAAEGGHVRPEAGRHPPGAHRHQCRALRGQLRAGGAEPVLPGHRWATALPRPGDAGEELGRQVLPDHGGVGDGHDVLRGHAARPGRALRRQRVEPARDQRLGRQHQVVGRVHEIRVQHLPPGAGGRLRSHLRHPARWVARALHGGRVRRLRGPPPVRVVQHRRAHRRTGWDGLRRLEPPPDGRGLRQRVRPRHRRPEEGDQVGLAVRPPLHPGAEPRAEGVHGRQRGRHRRGRPRLAAVRGGWRPAHAEALRQHQGQARRVRQRERQGALVVRAAGAQDGLPGGR
mmetsp:Transcript_51431/g.144945  ORF Transcript_51431/g.144945 Transcript_51431/m.144945 type:complete len:302 (-) Transcript_51431:191-1096(-)